MNLFVPKETDREERRIALIPENAKKLVALGIGVEIESGLGEFLHYSDAEFEAAGAKVSNNRDESLRNAEVVLRVGKPEIQEISKLSRDTLHISFLDPFNEKQLVHAFQEAGVSTISMEMMPRITIAQKMDALSSQASLAGYYAVVRAVERLDKILPMMMTPAGTISPARVFVIGVGVAGLQAIATAKRLGARVEAFDTRPEVEEQVKSLGAKFVKVDLGETGSTQQGYAKALTEEQLQKQREEMAKVCANSDIIITTAQLFGRKAPVVVTKDMVAKMKPGTIVVDLAVTTGGNVEGSEAGKEVNINGVRIVGSKNLPGEVPVHASQVYSSNLTNLIQHFWDKEKKELRLDPEDEIVQGCLVTHKGEIFNARLKEQVYGAGVDKK